jgi:hypothetical protein
MSMFPISILSGTFYYLCSVLDGCSRFLVHWDLRESMKEAVTVTDRKLRISSGCKMLMPYQFVLLFVLRFCEEGEWCEI